MLRCERCGAVFTEEELNWEEWFENRPVGVERMAEGHCPDCGYNEFEKVQLRRCYQCRAYEDGVCMRTDERRDEDDRCTEEEYESVPFPLWGF